MNYKLLRPGDGFPSKTPWLRGEVKRLQRTLTEAGYPAGADGYFGSDTEKNLKAFQEDHRLKADGIAGPRVHKALRPHWLKAIAPLLGAIERVLKHFRGDLDWVHLLEGHKGRPYWPKGSSGVTLDPGIDLGYIEPTLFGKLYGGALTEPQMAAVRKAMGLRGKAASAALQASHTLQSVRVSERQAEEIMPYAAKPYWFNIAHRFPSLIQPDTPSAVQTAMLSLAYNRGAGNPALEQLRAPIDAGDWHKLAALIGAMQQSHALEGVRKRRRWEEALIRSGIV